MTEHCKAIIFDLDGTLVDSMWVWPEIDKAYLGQFGITPPYGMEEELEGLSFTETAAYFKERFNISDSIEAIKDTWNKMAWEFYTEHITLKDGAYEFLKQTYKKGLRMGIATSNSIELVSVILERLAIKDYFHSIRTSCEVEKGKPYPYIYLKVAEDLEVEPEECLVFEDIPNGVIAAKRAGMQVWAINDHQKDDVKKKLREIADRFIYDYQEAINYFYVK
ncbi:HAD family hydrolase [Cellulosilyticum sp. I15G10I2]|uniref:HAD family hydrolase n=1 Tax=Cellulosilyticum sp. I15G10I2 TaxID=1892843 RepID=UPI00085BEBD9|nr:HAD family phosphatase [Cellulosilyticum sp. I15G10I2]